MENTHDSNFFGKTPNNYALAKSTTFLFWSLHIKLEQFHMKLQKVKKGKSQTLSCTSVRAVPTFTSIQRAAVFRTAGFHQNHPVALVVVNDVVLQGDGRHHIQVSKVLHK